MRESVRKDALGVGLFLAVAVLGGVVAFGASGCGDSGDDRSVCGNGWCEPWDEDAVSCPVDCGCGNGVLNAGEQCDGSQLGSASCEELGYAGGTLGCRSNCFFDVSACQDAGRCGDGVQAPGEACDDGNNVSGDGCSADCMSDETCGNGVLDVASGEQCDDGNQMDGDGCQSDCAVPTCGDGVLDSGEACDDGNQVDGDGCSAACVLETECGDGVVDTGEACDEGAQNSDVVPDACRSDCSRPRCGDGVVDMTHGEGCD